MLKTIKKAGVPMRELLLKIRTLLIRFGAADGRAAATAVTLGLLEEGDLFAFGERFEPVGETTQSDGIAPADALEATGAAYALQKRGEDAVIAAWVDEKHLDRALETAAALGLPLIMLYACHEAELDELSSRVMAADVSCVPADGRSVMKLMPALRLAVDRAREGDGSTLIECVADQSSDDEDAESGPLERLDNVLIVEGYAMPEELK